MKFTLLLLCIIFFHSIGLFGGVLQVDFFGETWGFFKTDGFSDELLDKSRLYLQLSIVAFISGALLAKRLGAKENYNHNYIRGNGLRIVGYFFLSISSIAVISLLLRGVDYAEYNSGGAAVERILLPFGIAGVTMLVLIKKTSYQLALYSALIVLLFVKTGARAEAIMQMMPLAALFLGKISSKKIYIAPFAIILLFYAISITRDMRGGFEPDLNPVTVITSTLIEGGFTSNLTPMTFEYVEANGHSFGLNYVGAILSVIPKLAFWMDHSQNSHTLSSALGFFYDPLLVTSGQGLGGSFIAESFFSFGWFGLITIVILGYLSFMVLEGKSLSLLALYLKYAFFGIILVGVRQDSVFVMRMGVWYVLMPYIIYIMICRGYGIRKN